MDATGGTGTFDALNPGDHEILYAFAQWQKYLFYGHATQSREWREMYIALLDRKTMTENSRELHTV